MTNVVSLSRSPPAEEAQGGNDTTTVGDAPAEQSRRDEARAQLRIPLREPSELMMHVNLLEAALEKCRKELNRARRNHRPDEALVLCRHHLQEVNRLMNVRRPHPHNHR